MKISVTVCLDFSLSLKLCLFLSVSIFLGISLCASVCLFRFSGTRCPLLRLSVPDCHVLSESVCVGVDVYVCLAECVYVRLGVSVCVRDCVRVCACVWVCVCVCVWLCVCVYVCLTACFCLCLSESVCLRVWLSFSGSVSVSSWFSHSICHSVQVAPCLFLIFLLCLRFSISSSVSLFSTQLHERESENINFLVRCSTW